MKYVNRKQFKTILMLGICFHETSNSIPPLILYTIFKCMDNSETRMGKESQPIFFSLNIIEIITYIPVNLDESNFIHSEFYISFKCCFEIYNKCYLYEIFFLLYLCKCYNSLSLNRRGNI